MRVAIFDGPYRNRNNSLSRMNAPPPSRLSLDMVRRIPKWVFRAIWARRIFFWPSHRSPLSDVKHNNEIDNTWFGFPGFSSRILFREMFMCDDPGPIKLPFPPARYTTSTGAVRGSWCLQVHLTIAFGGGVHSNVDESRGAAVDS